MKRLIILSAIVFSFMLSTINAKSIYNSYSDVSFFYGSLEPYGEWIEIGYDDYIWRPYKSDYNWRPYSDGRWEWTRHGWYWVSYEPFGWATYHYGRWYHDDFYGWVWMPDYEWAPSWVEWRYNDSHIGWAPLPPYAKYHRRNGISFSINWNSGYFYWNFVTYNHFTSHNIHHHFVHVNHVNKIYNKTKYRTNYYADNDRIVNGGVSRRFIEGKTGRKLTTKRIDRTDNFSNYKKRDLRESKGIVEYRPSEVTVRGTTINKKNVTKGKELSSLKRDKVVINKKNIIERESGTDLGKNEGSRKIDKKIFEKKSEKRNYNTSKNKNEALEKKENSNSKIIKKNEHKNNSKKTQNLNKYKEVTNRSYRENSNVRLDDKSKLTKISKKNESTKSNQKEISKRESNNFTRNNSSSTKSYTSNIDKKNTVNDDKSKKQRRR